MLCLAGLYGMPPGAFGMPPYAGYAPYAAVPPPGYPFTPQSMSILKST